MTRKKAYMRKMTLKFAVGAHYYYDQVFVHKSHPLPMLNPNIDAG